MAGNVVQKKLSQLESELSNGFFLLPHSESGHKIFRHLHKRFDYIRRLISAEAAASTSTSDESLRLRKAADKFDALETTFQFWNCALNNFLRQQAETATAAAAEEEEKVEGEDESPRVKVRGGGLGKMCGAFGAGCIVGAVAIINCSSLFFDIWESEYPT